MNELFSSEQTAASILLHEITELRAENDALCGEIVTLKAQIEELQEEIRRLRGGKGNSTALSIKPSRPPKEKESRKRRGHGFARRREPAQEEVTHAREVCPDCGRKLEGGWKHRVHQVIEIVLPQVKVVDHVLLRRRCGVCGKSWLPEVSPQEIGTQGRRRIGASVQSLVATLHIGARLPIKPIRSLLRELWGLQLSNGAVVKLLEGVKQAGESKLADLLAQVRKAPAVCADETGWREDGHNGYLWGFFTETARYFEYHQSRAAAVPEGILGEDFGGVVTCDFYAGYNNVGRLQRCWPHLLGDAGELAEINADRPQVRDWVAELKALYHEAKDFSSPLNRERRRVRKRFEQRAAKLARPYAEDPEAPQRVLSQRILKHLPELFVFVERPEVPGDNNLAERSLRPAVIARKISGGTRSPKGSKTRMGLMSLFATWKAQGKPLLATCRELLLAPT